MEGKHILVQLSGGWRVVVVVVIVVVTTTVAFTTITTTNTVRRCRFHAHSLAHSPPPPSSACCLDGSSEKVAIKHCVTVIFCPYDHRWVILCRHCLPYMPMSMIPPCPRALTTPNR